MVKYSFIIPIYDKMKDNNFIFCIESLLSQTFKDFEIIICGNKVQEETIQYLNNIKITNIVIDTNRPGKLMNVGLKIAKGDFIHIWCNDLVIYPDYLNKLNQYILNYGDNNLYAGHFIATDVRHAASRENSNNFYFDSFDKPEGFHVYHKRYLEFFNEEYEGYATHWSQEHCYRLWKKIKFICMQDNYVVHLPHYARLSEHDALNSSYKSSLIFEKIKHEI